VPEKTQHALFSRKQCVTNPERLARRRAKRKGETFEQALEHFTGFEGGFTKLPFVDLLSLSTNASDEKSGRFKLFIKRDIYKEPKIGKFTCYGLSQTATVPWF
jgi:CRISPR-associated endonuclease Csy4